MKIYVVGSGAIGGYFGGLLAKAGNDVTFVARGEHYQAIKSKGLKVKSIVGDFEIKPAQVIKNISEISSPDLVIFTVKTYDTDEVAKALVPVVNKNTIITNPARDNNFHTRIYFIAFRRSASTSRFAFFIPI